MIDPVNKSVGSTTSELRSQFKFIHFAMLFQRVLSDEVHGANLIWPNHLQIVHEKDRDLRRIDQIMDLKVSSWFKRVSCFFANPVGLIHDENIDFIWLCIPVTHKVLEVAFGPRSYNFSQCLSKRV